MYSNEAILIVEDNPAEADLIMDTLIQGRIANPVHHLTCAEEALDYLEGKGRYSDRSEFPLASLVLLDLNTPGMGGFEFIRLIRNGPFKRLPIIVLTHSKEESDMLRAYELGANSYLVKPFELDAFRALIKSFNAFWVLLAETPQL